MTVLTLVYDYNSGIWCDESLQNLLLSLRKTHGGS